MAYFVTLAGTSLYNDNRSGSPDHVVDLKNVDARRLLGLADVSEGTVEVILGAHLVQGFSLARKRKLTDERIQLSGPSYLVFPSHDPENISSERDFSPIFDG